MKLQIDISNCEKSSTNLRKSSLRPFHFVSKSFSVSLSEELGLLIEQPEVDLKLPLLQLLHSIQRITLRCQLNIMKFSWVCANYLACVTLTATRRDETSTSAPSFICFASLSAAYNNNNHLEHQNLSAVFQYHKAPLTLYLDS